MLRDFIPLAQGDIGSIPSDWPIWAALIALILNLIREPLIKYFERQQSTRAKEDEARIAMSIDERKKETEREITYQEENLTLLARLVEAQTKLVNRLIDERSNDDHILKRMQSDLTEILIICTSIATKLSVKVPETHGNGGTRAMLEMIEHRLDDIG